MNVEKLVTEENHLAINQVLVIAKQDMALDKAFRSLNDLCHINRIEFEVYGKNFGISPELLAEVKILQDKLAKAKYGRF